MRFESWLDVLNTVALMLCVSFCAYVAVILVSLLRIAPAQPGNADGFTWHIIVPCLNEAAVVGATIAELLRSFPGVTVWCVDDGSDDGTAEVLGRLAPHPRVRIVSRTDPDARQGKGAALNAAWREIHQRETGDRSRTVVGVVDAGSVLDLASLRILAGPSYFGDPSVSAIQIEVRMVNRPQSRWGRLLVRLQDVEFRGPIAAMQELRRRTGSVGMGSNGQFTRLSTLDRIALAYGSPWHGALLEDFELGLHVLLVGGSTEYCAQTWVAQEGLTSVGPLLRQRARWAQGSMQCARYLPAILRSRRTSNAAAFEIRYFLSSPWTQLAGTIVYLGCLAVLGWYSLTAPGRLDGWSVVPVVAMFGVAPFAVWGLVYRARCDRSLSIWAALGVGLCHWLYSYAQCVVVWPGLLRHIRARTEWQKTSRIAEANREGVGVGPRPDARTI